MSWPCRWPWPSTSARVRTRGGAGHGSRGRDRGRRLRRLTGPGVRAGRRDGRRPRPHRRRARAVFDRPGLDPRRPGRARRRSRTAGPAGYLPWPVVEGCTLGIACVIFRQQVPAAVGTTAQAGKNPLLAAADAVAPSPAVARPSGRSPPWHWSRPACSCCPSCAAGYRRPCSRSPRRPPPPSSSTRPPPNRRTAQHTDPRPAVLHPRRGRRPHRRRHRRRRRARRGRPRSGGGGRAAGEGGRGPDHHHRSVRGRPLRGGFRSCGRSLDLQHRPPRCRVAGRKVLVGEGQRPLWAPTARRHDHRRPDRNARFGHDRQETTN